VSDKYGYGNLDADTLAARTKIDRLEAENKILRRALDVAAGGSVHAVGMWADKAQAEIAVEDIAAKGGGG